MITVLTVEDKIREKIPVKLRTLLCADTIKTEEKTAKGIEVRHLIYINRRGKINWRRISRKAGSDRSRLIYCGPEKISQGSGIVPFLSEEYKGRLCANMAIDVLRRMKNVPKSMRVGVYDPNGEATDLVEHLLRFTDNLVVVTKNREMYEAQARRLMWEMGAVLCVSLRPSALSACGFIISPHVVDVRFTPMTKAVVMTCAVPKVPLGCTVFHRFFINLQKDIASLCPDSVEVDTFAAGLYSLCGVYELGSVVPYTCGSDNDTRDIEVLSKYFEDNFGT